MEELGYKARNLSLFVSHQLVIGSYLVTEAI